MKQYSSYIDSGIQWLNEIPAHWKILPGRALFAENKEKNDGGEHQVLSLSYGSIIIKKNVNEGLIPENYSSYQYIRPGYIIVRCTDLQNDKVSLRTSISEYEGIITGAYLGLIPKPICRSKFIHYLLRAWDCSKELYRYGSGLRQSLSWNDFKYLLLPIPTPEEQDAIVAYLDAATAKIDEAISQQQCMIDLLNERKQIIIGHAVSKGLHNDVLLKESGFDWIGLIPSHWKVIKTSYVFTHIGSGTTPSSGREDYYSEDGFYFLQTGDLNDGYIKDTSRKITEKALKEVGLKVYPKGSLVIAMYGATIGKLGILDIDTIVNQACCVLPETPSMDTRYAFYLFSAAKNDLIQQSKGGGQPNISQDTIRNERIIVPPLKEQIEIAKFIDSVCIPINTAISNANLLIERLQERKQIIINEVVTGKTKV